MENKINRNDEVTIEEYEDDEILIEKVLYDNLAELLYEMMIEKNIPDADKLLRDALGESYDRIFVRLDETYNIPQEVYIQKER